MVIIIYSKYQVKEFEKTNLKLLELFRQNYLTEVALGKDELKRIVFYNSTKSKKCNYT